ncbi:putative transposase [Hyphomicrobium sp.]|uniref:putative transposase n=1 Tax=Hyphomicrobium sp. TaxID=82 RepID=UPI0025B90B80|nr:helix-turn-helix domain-containing protein [Hyphomicrobium sp.]MCC7253627.1 helix-turn-helix domain-containing protein [Hyphomicrobium sp.]
MSQPSQCTLFADATDASSVAINARCLLRTVDDRRAVVVAGVPVAHYTLGDAMAEAHAMVSLVDQGWATQRDVARAFGCAARSVRRCQRRFEQGGLAALGRRPGYPRGRPRLRPSRRNKVLELKASGVSNREIAVRLGVTEKAVRKLLARLGFKPAAPAQQALPLSPSADPNLSASSAPTSSMPAAQRRSSDDASGAPDAPGADPNVSAFSSTDAELSITADIDPLDRSGDRLLAHLGLLNDALPLFAPGKRLPCAGVMLALPAVRDSGVIDCAREIYGCIGPAFFGLRTTVVALVLMALLRIRHPENLKEHPPAELGRVLGLDRAPEVKTLRRKLARLAAVGRATDFGRALARRRVATHGSALGFLYVDGHVRVYHGKREVSKTHVARMRIAMPGITDYWVNDARGEPLFVVTGEANTGLCKALPGILGEVRALIGERRTTVVFDRGGWSPVLFARLIGDGFDILTYRKGRCPKVPTKRFSEHEAELDGRQVRYCLADQGIRLLGGKLRLRQVTRLSNGHQTHVVTSRRDLAAIEVAFRMFERWRQENFFKYMRQEFALDALADYAVEEDDPERDVPNPRWAAIDLELRTARAELQRVTARYGLEAVTNEERLRRTMRGFKIANAAAGRAVTSALKRCVAIESRRAKVPRRLPAQQVHQGEVIKLAAETKHLTSLLKMVAYQAEGELVRLLAPHYRRAEDDGRTLIQNALASAADIDVTDTELRVTVAPLSSAHRTRALAALCEQLDATKTVFPGTQLRLRYAVAAAS